MLLSKTFIGLARTIKSRYSFQWQYLGADLQPLWVETARCYLGCLFWWRGWVPIHHLYLQEKQKCAQGPLEHPAELQEWDSVGWIPGFAQESQWMEFRDEPEAERARRGLWDKDSDHEIITHTAQAAGLRLQGSSSNRLISDLSFHINPGSVRKPWTLQAQLCVGHVHQALGSAGASVHLLARNAKPALFPHFPREKNKYITEPNAFQHKAKTAGDGSVVLGCSVVKYYYCNIIVIALQNNFSSFLFLEVKKSLYVWTCVCVLLKSK